MGKHTTQKDLRDVIADRRRTVHVEEPIRPTSQVEILDDGLPDRNARPSSPENESQAVAPSIQAQLDALTAVVQGLLKRPSAIDRVDHRSGNPFYARIRAAQPPAKYKAPILPVYTEKADPIRHVGKFEDQMELLEVSDDYRCRVFPTTLSNIAQEWYWKFKPNSITSWESFRKEFCRQFSAAWTPLVYANHLEDIKQGKEKSLKNYIQRFMREANRATAVGDEGKMVAISSGIIHRSPLWDSIHRNPISTLQQFLDRADKYMKLDDAIKK